MSHALSACSSSALRWPSWRTLALLMLFTAGVRGGTLALLPAGLNHDPDTYRELAQNLATTGTFGHSPASPPGTHHESAPAPTAFRPPLYPMFLAPWVRQGRLSATHIAALHFALGLATVGLVVLVALRWELGSSAILAAALVACDPILLKQSTEVMTETLATFMAVLGLYALTRFQAARTPWNASLAGGALALAVLCRPSFLVWLALVAPGLWLRSADNRQRQLANAAAFTLAAAAILAPWAIRNAREIGAPVVTTTHGGYTLWLGNNGEFYAYLRKENAFVAFQEPAAPAVLALGARNDEANRFSKNGELIRSKHYYRAARQAMQQDPPALALACAYRLRRFWGLWPYPLEACEPIAKFWLRQATALWYTLLWACALVGACTLRKKLLQGPWLWGTLLVLAFSAVHALYWTDLRMRAPCMPYLALVAALGVEQLGTWLRPARLLFAQRQP